ncbi:hypothetical protein ACFYRL_30920 [Streptomyces goshikiensis]|uniref:hypothetical protein n=1 Tax=Streptomyces goshikiensis TaxID=1942 RepID=UPI00367DE2BF
MTGSSAVGGLGLPGLYLAWTAFGTLYCALLLPRYRKRFKHGAQAAETTPSQRLQ